MMGISPVRQRTNKVRVTLMVLNLDPHCTKTARHGGHMRAGSTDTDVRDRR
jgi:hypothetical protein